MSSHNQFVRASAVSHQTNTCDTDENRGSGSNGRGGPTTVTSASQYGSRLSERPESELEDDRLTMVRNSGECRLMRAINEVFGLSSRRCSTGCLYSMDDVIPSGYLLLLDEQNRSWFRMQMPAGGHLVRLWYEDFMEKMQDSLDTEARSRLFQLGNTHVFAGAGRRTAVAGSPLHCRRFAYLPVEILQHPTLMLHHLPISPEQVLLIDHAMQAAAYVPVTVAVGVTKQTKSN